MYLYFCGIFHTLRYRDAHLLIAYSNETIHSKPSVSIKLGFMCYNLHCHLPSGGEGGVKYTRMINPKEVYLNEIT